MTRESIGSDRSVIEYSRREIAAIASSLDRQMLRMEQHLAGPIAPVIDGCAKAASAALEALIAALDAELARA